MSDPLKELLIGYQRSAEVAQKSLEKRTSLEAKQQAKTDFHNEMLALKQREQQNKEDAALLDVIETANQDRSLKEVLTDSATSLGKGAVSVGQTAYGLTDLISRFNPVTLIDATQNKLRGGEFDAVNFGSLDETFGGSQKFNETREILNQAQSDQINAERELLQRNSQLRDQRTEESLKQDPSLLNKAANIAGNFTESVKDFATSPSSVLDTTLESLPLMLGPGAITQQLNKKLVKDLTEDAITNIAKKEAKGKLTSKTADQVVNRFLQSKAGKKATADIAAKAGITFTAASEGISNGLQVQGEIMSAKHEDLLESSPEYARLISICYAFVRQSCHCLHSTGE